MAGALPEAELPGLVARAGLAGLRIVRRFDCFAGTPAGDMVADHMGLCGATIAAFKPDPRFTYSV